MVNFSIPHPSGQCCSQRSRNLSRLEYDEIDEPGLADWNPRDPEQRGLLAGSVDIEMSIEKSAERVSVIVPQAIPTWKRNVARLLLTLCIVGAAVVLKDSYAYLAAFTGLYTMYTVCMYVVFVQACMWEGRDIHT